jgi:hypothetical protein
VNLCGDCGTGEKSTVYVRNAENESPSQAATLAVSAWIISRNDGAIRRDVQHDPSRK